MTNNEAAKWIQLYIDLAKIDPTTGEAAYLNDDNKKTIEAMEMAVNTLTAQPEKTQLSEEEATSDCISRQAAIDAALEFFVEFLGGAFHEDDQKILMKRMNELPSAQPERKNGKWVNCYTDGFGNMCKCSECGARIDIQEKFRSFFCYHCGTDMREDVLPPVQPEPHWIPCKERMPEEYGEYRITWTTSASKKRFVGDSEYEVTSEWDDEHYRFKGEWLLDDYIKNYPDVKVIAWKPLEEPYREGE